MDTFSFSPSSPVTIRALLAVILSATMAGCGGSPTPVAAVPDLTGTWGHQRVFAIDEVCAEELPGGSLRAVECADAPAAPPDDGSGSDFPTYRPEFAAEVMELRARQVALDTVLRCHPPGVPRIGPPAKIVQNAREIVFLYDDQNGSFYRIIPIDGRQHRTGISSSYLGDAVGRFEGDTLMVETVNLTDETWLTDNGAFHTRDLRVVERLRRVGDTLEWQATAYDPEVLAEPWITRRRVMPRSDRELEEPPRCEERDLEHMVDPSQFHENPR
jgi:hypothetical protein